MNISLIGLPGSGKTTVGRQLARRLEYAFVDCDLEVERQIGCSIKDYFERNGEESFRDLEAKLLCSLVHLSATVISTGGGVVGRAENREILHSTSCVIYLHSTPDEVFRRLRHDQSRPLLLVADPVARLEEMYVVRNPLYREVAHLVIETGLPTVSALVNTIVARLQAIGPTVPVVGVGQSPSNS